MNERASDHVGQRQGVEGKRETEGKGKNEGEGTRNSLKRSKLDGSSTFIFLHFLSFVSVSPRILRLLSHLGSFSLLCEFLIYL